MAGLQVYYLYEVFVTNDTGGFAFSLGSVLLILWSVVTVLAMFQCLAHASQRRWVNVALSMLGLAVYTICASYTFGSNDALNWSVLADNFGIAFSQESLDVLIHSLDAKGLQYGGIIFLVFSWLEYKYQTITRATPPIIPLKKKVVSWCMYGILVLLPIEAMDPLMNFIRSGYFYYRDQQSLNVQLTPNHYPLIRSKPNTSAKTAPAPKPQHVFLIVVESLNADVIHNISSNGRPLTPFLNQLQERSISFSTFYGNSIQTAKGHFALLFSTIPSLKGKTFVKYPNLSIDSVASVLKSNGYQTIAFSAHENPNFDNASSFLTQRGYDDYLTVKPFLAPDDAKHRLRWGVKDAIFYKRFFEYFDSVSKKGPGFFTLFTIANHFPFNSMSAEDRPIYPEPSSIQEHYANSIALVDDGIRVFFEALEKRQLLDNSLVIITADHAFPMGLHGNYHLEAGYHEDSFRIPCFISWPTQLSPRVSRQAGSQMDIGPTILDALGIALPSTHFGGESLLSDAPQHPIFLVQPYAKHFSVVRFPYKYRFFAKTEQEFVYDLTNDPLEQTSIIHTLSDHQLTQFRQDLKRMYWSQAAIENNQVIRPNQ